MIRNLVTGFLLVSCVLTDVLEIRNNIILPQVLKQQIPLKTVSKLPNENFVQTVKNINFEYTSYLYYNEGALSGKEIYNISNYKGTDSPCKIYKTDLKLRQYKDVSYTLSPQSMLVIQNSNLTQNKNYGSVFVAHQNDQVDVYRLSLPANADIDSFNNSPEFESFGLSVQIAGNFSVQTSGPTDTIHMLDVDGQAYVVTSDKIFRYKLKNNGGDKQFITGYLTTDPISKVGCMDSNTQNNNSRFYVLTNKQLIIYEFQTKDSIKLLKTINNFNESNLLAATYQKDYFYITAYNKLYIVKATNFDNVQVTQAKLNGTCTHLQLFQTTLHISCEYERLSYLVEAYALGVSVIVNRYYASQDLRGRVVARRLGFSKMAIISDQDLRIVSFGINRNVLLQNQVLPPEFVFNIKYGINVLPLKKITTAFSYGFLAFTAQKLAYMQIKQNPPQLYCEFSGQKPGAKHQVLMQFNQSKCTYVKSEQDLFFGNLENVCQVSIPILIQTKQVILQAKHVNFIQITMGLLIVGSILVLIACAIKCNKLMKVRFEKAEKILEKAKKGFKVDSNIISTI